MDIKNIRWYGHDSFSVVTKDGKVIYFDPYQLSGQLSKADIIFISHEHFDHCSQEDIDKIVGESTIIIGSAQASDIIKQDIQVMKPGEETVIEGIKVKAVPAYNVNKFREPNIPFHPKEDQKLGFVVSVDDVTFYHAGDTDLIPEMENIISDVAFLPVSGTYVMTAQEAAKAADVIKPQVAIPMHYGSIVGSVADAEKFRDATEVAVKIFTKV